MFVFFESKKNISLIQVSLQ